MRVKIGSTELQAEVADTFLKRAKGLMFRDSLPKGEGMLLSFDQEGRHEIWMFGMKFPLDIIWIGKDGRVVDIAENAKPCLLFCKNYFPSRKAKYVLEVDSGFARRNKVRIGSEVNF